MVGSSPGSVLLPLMLRIEPPGLQDVAMSSTSGPTGAVILSHSDQGHEVQTGNATFDVARVETSELVWALDQVVGQIREG